MTGGDDDHPAKPPGTWPPDAEYAVPTGSPDVYDPAYVPPAADPAHDDAHAEEGPPAALYPDAAPDQAPGTDPNPLYGPIPADDALYGPVSPNLGAATGDGRDGRDDAPLLPPELAGDAALQAAVGPPSPRARRRAATQPRGDDDGDDPRAQRRGRRTMAIASLAIVGGLGTIVLVFLGRANAQRYLITCDASHAVAEQGRSFPPWGSRSLRGAEWTPIALPADAECQPRETGDVAELAKWYLDLLVARATTTLTARDLLDSIAAPNQPAGNPLDTAAAQLDQALLLARDPDRRDERKEIHRLQGDVEYWRAAARLRDASAVLLEAARQFEDANQKHPRHATDAAAWASFLHRLAGELHAGPNGLAPATGPAGTGPTGTRSEPASAPAVPVGTALPVEPADGSDGSNASDGSGGSGAPAPPPAPAVPSGGVLL